MVAGDLPRDMATRRTTMNILNERGLRLCNSQISNQRCPCRTRMNSPGKDCFTSKRQRNWDTPRHNAWWPMRWRRVFCLSRIIPYCGAFAHSPIITTTARLPHSPNVHFKSPTTFPPEENNSHAPSSYGTFPPWTATSNRPWRSATDTSSPPTEENRHRYWIPIPSPINTTTPTPAARPIITGATPIPTTGCWEPVPRRWHTTKPPLTESWTNWSRDPPKPRSTPRWTSIVWQKYTCEAEPPSNSRGITNPMRSRRRCSIIECWHRGIIIPSQTCWRRLRLRIFIILG
mmetsp:Transcript_15828/g.32252  ORF Transcript_15828/g.32252 Transcript_15828/m.32252 type:complete len:288 (+) Transcript_15828:443-1306(+)